MLQNKETLFFSSEHETLGGFVIHNYVDAAVSDTEAPESVMRREAIKYIGREVLTATARATTFIGRSLFNGLETFLTSNHVKPAL